MLATLMVQHQVKESRSVVSESFTTPGTVAHQAPLSIEFSRQEHGGGLPFPSPGDFPHPGIKPRSPALQADSLPLGHQDSAPNHVNLDTRDLVFRN